MLLPPLQLAFNLMAIHIEEGIAWGLHEAASAAAAQNLLDAVAAGHPNIPLHHMHLANVFQTGPMAPLSATEAKEQACQEPPVHETGNASSCAVRPLACGVAAGSAAGMRSDDLQISRPATDDTCFADVMELPAEIGNTQRTAGRHLHPGSPAATPSEELKARLQKLFQVGWMLCLCSILYALSLCCDGLNNGTLASAEALKPFNMASKSIGTGTTPSLVPTDTPVVDRACCWPVCSPH
jgi:hypothetical protein